MTVDSRMACMRIGRWMALNLAVTLKTFVRLIHLVASFTLSTEAIVGSLASKAVCVPESDAAVCRWTSLFQGV